MPKYEKRGQHTLCTTILMDLMLLYFYFCTAPVYVYVLLMLKYEKQVMFYYAGIWVVLVVVCYIILHIISCASIMTFRTKLDGDSYSNGKNWVASTNLII